MEADRGHTSNGINFEEKNDDGRIVLRIEDRATEDGIVVSGLTRNQAYRRLATKLELPGPDWLPEAVRARMLAEVKKRMAMLEVQEPDAIEVEEKQIEGGMTLMVIDLRSGLRTTTIGESRSQAYRRMLDRLRARVKDDGRWLPLLVAFEERLQSMVPDKDKDLDVYDRLTLLAQAIGPELEEQLSAGLLDPDADRSPTSPSSAREWMLLLRTMRLLLARLPTERRPPGLDQFIDRPSLILRIETWNRHLKEMAPGSEATARLRETIRAFAQENGLPVPEA